MTETSEICKMLVISTGHLCEHACNTYLENEDNLAYPKGEWGYFLYVYNEFEELPDSLADCLGYAKDKGCAWIMFEVDGPIMDGLTFYEW